MGDNKSGFIIFGCITALLLLFMYGGGGNTGIDRSPIGTTGLSVWLEENDIRTDRSHRRTTLTEQDIALRILPLYDVELDRDAPVTANREERRSGDNLRDIDRSIYYEKVRYVPTLVALPKWRAGVLELGLVDKQLLIPTFRLKNLRASMNVPNLRIVRPTDKFLADRSGVTLYAPQLFETESVRGDCRPTLSLDAGVLIAQCAIYDAMPHYILSDPDFMNNHGLALGDNAAIALDVINGLVDGRDGTVYIDTASDILLAPTPDAPREIRPRTTEEISRFLTYPFSLIWIGACICFVVLLWRGLIRFGPPGRVGDGRIAASKTASIESKGYLLRLAGEDHALLRAYVTDKMVAVGHDIMGRHVQIERPKLIKRLKAIAPKIAPDLEAALEAVDQMDAQTTRADLTRLAERFEEIYRRLRDELGHVSRRR
ncbi:hypothetical protein [Yoonia sediminilitoris]|uniref:DUF4350 domain-containing protein n=1 Tax=Yoonia sediminilitoris TaxID=1286148 RepID=A0A2T6KMT4_9RHOB|nr:hypothetical protein [Yoonia sediminilitoris]PUB17484.1 hypothetical protein C8N45_102496 [Yoonia sediminilitoris]RCW97779.1 hypothetical protein DFP92_102496 [Yoonia sediminilitoris]